MLTDLLPDPFLWFSHHQWGIFLSGFIGAGLGGLIAVGALYFTLRTQQRQYSVQLSVQAASVDAQLKAQTAALERQAAEASKERELSARAELIASLQDLIDVPMNTNKQYEACNRISSGIERLRFELQGEDDRPLWQELAHWRSVFSSLTQGEYPIGGSQLESFDAECLLIQAACSSLMNALVEFRRNFDGTNWTAAEVARVLREFRENSLTEPGHNTPT